MDLRAISVAQSQCCRGTKCCGHAAVVIRSQVADRRMFEQGIGGGILGCLDRMNPTEEVVIGPVLT